MFVMPVLVKLVLVQTCTGRRMREIAIELLLLLRRQQCANRIVSLVDDLIVLAAEIFVQPIHFGVRIAQ